MDIRDRLAVALDEAGRKFFRNQGRCDVSREVREDVVGAAHELLLRNRSVLAGKKEVLDPIGFCTDIISKAYGAYLKHEAWCKRATSLAALDVEHLRTVDPLSSGSAIYLTFATASVNLCGRDAPPLTPPYKVEFASDYTDLDRYRSEHYYIPPFGIVPLERGVEAVPHRKLGGRGIRTRRYGDELSLFERLALHNQRVNYALAVRRMLPRYLKQHGYKSLEGKQKKLLGLLNRNVSKVEMCRAMGITPQSLERAICSLERRGYEATWSHWRQQVLYVYNPVLDGAREFTSKERLEHIQKLTFSEIIELTGERMDEAVTGEALTEEVFEQEYHRAREHALRSAEDYAIEYDYDFRLRQFIRDTVERPAHIQGMNLSEVERLLSLLPKERQEEVVLEAIRTRNSIVDLLALPDYYPELYRMKEPTLIELQDLVG